MKVNLLIDTNNLFYPNTNMKKYAAKVGKTFPTSEKVLGTPEETEIYIDKIDTDLRMVLQNFSQVENIYFLMDGKSWRKKMLIDGKPFYKENRTKKNLTVDWPNFQHAIETLIESGDKHKSLRINGLEADDLMYLANQKLLEDPEVINIILSTDGDMRQLLGQRTIIYNPTMNYQRLIFPNGLNIKDIKEFELNTTTSIYEKTTTDLFDMSGISFSNVDDTSTPLYEKLESKLDIEHVDKHEMLTSKVLLGDKKDNVPSIHHWINSNGNETRITPRHVKPVIEWFLENELIFNIRNVLKNYNTILDILSEATKQNLQPHKDDILVNIKRNIKLLYLSRKTIPSKLCEKFDSEWEEIH